MWKTPLTLVMILAGFGLAFQRLLLGQGYSPDEAAKRMTLANGLEVKLVACEPMVRQPVAIEFDDRGRLWVIQYLQYPNPAGLKRIKVDRYSRTVYDRVPEPPPRGPKGDDRITILYDFDNEGRARRAKDFVNGLNLATGLAFGHGGVFVLQAPYLLFYPDRNGDDVTDGDPEVLLSGFGMEDASSVANSLTWGPDGWLYGCQGSTVTAHIRGIDFQQGVWRYHPITRRFELFCEGGGNCWGLDFDRHGNLLYSTNVGGFVTVHGVQGGYYWKEFGKHGALHNPYTFGHFDHVPHRNFKGGHVTVGGIVYRGDSFPNHLRDKYISADLLGHAVYWHNLEPWGSTFRSSHGGELLLANDTWFAPCDLTLGPDGSVYVADWYDKRTAHPDPEADWDRSNGRIYKIQTKSNRFFSCDNLTKLESKQLVALLSHPNDWYVRKARRILADRRDPEVVGSLRNLIFETKDDQLALEALWALYVSAGIQEDFALKLLEHRNPDVRRWTVRLLGDENTVSPVVGKRLISLAKSEKDVYVRSQLASTAKRLPAKDGLAIVQSLLHHKEDEQDPHMPLLLWWAVERHAVGEMEMVMEIFGTDEAWSASPSSMIRETVERLIRRYAAEGSVAAFTACARLLTSAPAGNDKSRMLAALDQGLQDRPPTGDGQNFGSLLANYAPVQRQNHNPRQMHKLPAELEKQLDELWNDKTVDVTLTRLMARLGKAAAQSRAVTLAVDSNAPLPTRLAMLQTIEEVGAPEAVEPLLSIVKQGTPETLQAAALRALQHFDLELIADRILQNYSQFNERVRGVARKVLLSRKGWALKFLRKIDQGKVAAQEVPVDQVRQVSLFRDAQLDQLVRKHWGNIQPGTPEEKLATIRRFTNDLRAGKGNPVRGRELFAKQCGICHQFFGEGTPIGPDLTHANRQDRDFLLVSIVDPSAVIRKEYLSYVVQTKDGRVLTGLLAGQGPNGVTLLDGKNDRTTIKQDQVESIQASTISLMPENTLQDLQPQELRDLFSYLESDQPPAQKRADP